MGNGKEMGNLSDLDWDDIDESKSGSFDPLPVGSYIVEIISTETRDNNAGTGNYLSVTYEVIDGDHKGRRVWENLTLSHPTQTAVEIGRAKLKRLIKTLGFTGINDSSEMHGHQLNLKLTQKPRKDTKEIQNEVKGYEPLTAPEKPAQHKPQANGAKAPWAKK